jgi:tetratricopeptide (TPR) repeat protein
MFAEPDRSSKDEALPRDPRREVVESRALSIKTNNLVSALSAEIKTVAHRLDHRERRMVLNSAVAYVLFVVLLAGAFYVIHHTRLEHAEIEKDGALREAAAIREQLAQVNKRDEERGRGETRAFELYQLLRGGKVRDAVSRYPEIARERLSRTEAEVLREAVLRARQDLAASSFDAGRQAYGASQWKRATQEFRRSVEADPAPAHAATLYYLYGISLYKVGDFAGAARELERAIEHGAERNVHDDAGFYFAAALDQAKQRDRAKAEYQKFLQKFPGHRFAGPARRRLVELSTGP